MRIFKLVLVIMLDYRFKNKPKSELQTFLFSTIAEKPMNGHFHFPVSHLHLLLLSPGDRSSKTRCETEKIRAGNFLAATEKILVRTTKPLPPKRQQSCSQLECEATLTQATSKKVHRKRSLWESISSRTQVPFPRNQCYPGNCRNH